MAPNPGSPTTIAIIGAGFSGTSLALHLLEQPRADLRIHLLERSSRFGPGLAYATPHRGHRLNVPAGRMGVLADRVSDFLDWLRTRPELGDSRHDAFVARGHYGAYLQDRLRSAVAAHGPARIDLRHDSVTAIQDRPGGVTVRLASGGLLRVDVAVLATGHPGIPAAFGGAGLAGLGVWRPDPWAPEALADLDPAAPVLLLGTGLTMIDMAVQLLDRGHAGPIHALSRRGLLPRMHPAVLPPAPAASGLPTSLPGLLLWVRRASRDAGPDWPLVIDSLRPHTQALWQGFSLAEKQQFLRHVRPYWDVCRHRMAPDVGARIATLLRRGRLRVWAGHVGRVTEADSRAVVDVRLRGRRGDVRLDVARAVNCTGTAADITETGDPLLRDLLDRGLVRPDPLRLGVDVTAAGMAIARNGRVSGRLFALGPLTKGAAWEIVAVPDIRRQCATLAHLLADRLPATPLTVTGSGCW